jgi:hypothetical protein
VTVPALFPAFGAHTFVMRYLYAVYVLSILALIWAVISIARHIRGHNAQAPKEGSESIPETATRTSLE